MTTLKFMKLLMSLLLGSLFFTNVHAIDYQTTVPWTKNNDGSAGVAYSKEYSEEIKIFEAIINHSKSGNQRLYFNDLYIEDINSCKYKTSTPDSTTIVFNGQAVKMLRWCKKFANADKYYYELTPETDRGESYVINIFKVATSPIEIQYDNETLYFPVIGFTKAWNSAGGNAI